MARNRKWTLQTHGLICVFVTFSQTFKMAEGKKSNSPDVGSSSGDRQLTPIEMMCLDEIFKLEDLDEATKADIDAVVQDVCINRYSLDVPLGNPTESPSFHSVNLADSDRAISTRTLNTLEDYLRASPDLPNSDDESASYFEGLKCAIHIHLPPKESEMFKRGLYTSLSTVKSCFMKSYEFIKKAMPKSKRRDLEGAEASPSKRAYVDISSCIGSGIQNLKQSGESVDDGESVISTQESIISTQESDVGKSSQLSGNLADDEQSDISPSQ